VDDVAGSLPAASLSPASRRYRAMPTSFALPAELVDRVRSLAAELESFVTDARDEWNERSERWQESGDGVDADGWLEEVEQVGEALTGLPTKPE
jgi:hypothetical protein